MPLDYRHETIGIADIDLEMEDSDHVYFGSSARASVVPVSGGLGQQTPSMAKEREFWMHSWRFTRIISDSEENVNHVKRSNQTDEADEV